jgi:hypothetical protein
VYVSVLLYVPALASPGITTARLGVVVSAAKSHSPWPVFAAAVSIVTAVVLSTCAPAATGPIVAELPALAAAVVGVSVSDPPVPTEPPVSVGPLAATVTNQPPLLPVASVTFHAPTSGLIV